MQSRRAGSVDGWPQAPGPVGLTAECHADGIVLSPFGLSLFATRWQRDDAATLRAFLEHDDDAKRPKPSPGSSFPCRTPHRISRIRIESLHLQGQMSWQAWSSQRRALVTVSGRR